MRYYPDIIAHTQKNELVIHIRITYILYILYYTIYIILYIYPIPLNSHCGWL